MRNRSDGHLGGVEEKLMDWYQINQSKKRMQRTKNTKSAEALLQSKPSINYLSRKLANKQKQSQEYREFKKSTHKQRLADFQIEEVNSKKEQPYQVISIPVSVKVNLPKGQTHQVKKESGIYRRKGYKNNTVNGIQFSDLKHRFENPFHMESISPEKIFALQKSPSQKPFKPRHIRIQSTPTTASLNKSSSGKKPSQYKPLNPTFKPIQFSSGFNLKEFVKKAKPMVSYSSLIPH